MTEDLLHLWTGTIEGISLRVLNRIIDYFGSISALWEADADRILENIKEKYAQMIIKSRDIDKIKEYSYKLQERNISYIYPGHIDYPKQLMNIPDAPGLLYLKGDRTLLKETEENAIAIVGARKASAYGREMAYRFSYEMAKAGITIVSGLAYGIDETAHKAALDASGKTIGVLGCGINRCYPKENSSLYEKMCGCGLLVSEYGLDIPPNSYQFPIRNRIISGISKGVLVVEAREKSGSLITADQALEQGRDVYVVPGRINDVNSVGCNNLIKQGAACVTSPYDIMFQIPVCNKMKEEKNLSLLNKENDVKKNLAYDEKMVYSCVRLEQRHIDDICAELGMPVSKVVELLFLLEQKKLIKQTVRNYYIRY